MARDPNRDLSILFAEIVDPNDGFAELSVRQGEHFLHFDRIVGQFDVNERRVDDLQDMQKALLAVLIANPNALLSQDDLREHLNSRAEKGNFGKQISNLRGKICPINIEEKFGGYVLRDDHASRFIRRLTGDFKIYDDATIAYDDIVLNLKAVDTAHLMRLLSDETIPSGNNANAASVQRIREELAQVSKSAEHPHGLDFIETVPNKGYSLYRHPIAIEPPDGPSGPQF